MAKWTRRIDGTPEREHRKNMVTLTPQFKIKRDLEWREFARVVYADFLERVYRPSIKKNASCEAKGGVRKSQPSKDIASVGRDKSSEIGNLC